MSNKLRQFQLLLNEGISHEDLTDVLHNRLQFRYPDIIDKYGYDAVDNTVSDVASFHAGAEELGSSDISIMLKEIIKQLESSQVAEGFPYDVDHMNGPIIRNADMITDNVKVNDEAQWDRAVNSINSRVFDDNADYIGTSSGKQMEHNGVIFAIWDKKTNTGWFNSKGRQVKPHKLGEEADQTPGVRTKYRATVEYGPTAADAKFVTVTASSTEEAEQKVLAWCKKNNVYNPMVTINGADLPSSVTEAGYYNPLDQERREQDYMDREKRDFKRREHDAEWEIEKRLAQQRAEQEAGTWYIRINGKIFKDRATGEPAAFNGKKHANAVAVKMMQKDFNKGKEFMLTTKPVDVVKNLEESKSKAMADTAKRLANKDDGKEAKHRAARDTDRQKKQERSHGQPHMTTEDSDPCWDNYKQIGMKMKGGKKVPNCVPKESVAEGSDDDIWGPQGKFAGDTKVELGNVSMKNIQVGDVVTYFGEKAKVLELGPTQARISANGKTLNVRKSDLKQLGRGMAEGSYEETEETAVINMFEKLVKQGRDPIDMITHKFGWGSYELDQLAKNLGFKNSADWAHGVTQGKGVNDGMMEDWQKVNKSDKTDGMSPKAVSAYRRENPGSKLKTAVTKKPSELKAGSKDAKRRKSFCARMSGMKGPMKDEKGRPTAKAKALSRWNCNESEQLDELSNEKLAQYKTAAGKDAIAADKAGDFKRGDKRFKGIVKATNKQFANDAKQVKESSILNGINKVRLDEGWKSALAGAALTGLAALGGGNAQATDLGHYNTQYLQQVASGNHPRPLVSIEDAKAELQARAQGKQQIVAPEPDQTNVNSGPRGSNLKPEVLQQLKAGTYKGFAPRLSPEEIDAAIAYQQGTK